MAATVDLARVWAKQRDSAAKSWLRAKQVEESFYLAEVYGRAVSAKLGNAVSENVYDVFFGKCRNLQ